MFYRRLARPALFRLGGGDAERAHEWTLRRLERLSRRSAALALLRGLAPPSAPRTVFGVRFPNPVGLAAGVDKDGRALRAWAALGFGFVEAGTVTGRAQPGNPRPRLFRLPEHEAIINRMGFNNAGAEALAARLAAGGRGDVPLGISLGKSKVTPLDEAVEDYLSSLRAVRPYADYLAINVSSPNTPGLRSLQDGAQLAALLGALRVEAGPTPLLVKIAPDLTDHAIGEVLEVCAEHGVAGLIATNTTLSRDGLAGSDPGEAGGLSGRPLTRRALDVVTFVCKRTDLPVIGVGGIMTPDDAVRMFDAGASLVQLYSGLIYRGPGLVRDIVKATR
ncbi:MAG TPA: quinone-dependent dihydroorotate dehydrogenase [Rugosimonospora sp.]